MSTEYLVDNPAQKCSKVQGGLHRGDFLLNFAKECQAVVKALNGKWLLTSELEGLGCNKVVVMVRVRVRLKVKVRVWVRVRLGLESGLW